MHSTYATAIRTLIPEMPLAAGWEVSATQRGFGNRPPNPRPGVASGKRAFAGLDTFRKLGAGQAIGSFLEVAPIGAEQLLKLAVAKRCFRRSPYSGNPRLHAKSSVVCVYFYPVGGNKKIRVPHSSKCQLWDRRGGKETNNGLRLLPRGPVSIDSP